MRDKTSAQTALLCCDQKFMHRIQVRTFYVKQGFPFFSRVLGTSRSHDAECRLTFCNMEASGSKICKIHVEIKIQENDLSSSWPCLASACSEVPWLSRNTIPSWKKKYVDLFFFPSKLGGLGSFWMHLLHFTADLCIEAIYDFVHWNCPPHVRADFLCCWSGFVLFRCSNTLKAKPSK